MLPDEYSLQSAIFVQTSHNMLMDSELIADTGHHTVKCVLKGSKIKLNKLVFCL